MDAIRLAGLVLAGGGASRLGGVDKPMLTVGGAPVLGRAVAALAGTPSVLVGTPRPGFERSRWTCEDPPGGGPIAAVAAGLAELPRGCDPIAVLAGDLLGVSRETVLRLCDAIGQQDGALLVDATGRKQWLIGVWRAHALRDALPAHPAGASLGSYLGALSGCEVAELPGESRDVDTPEDLDSARRESTP